MMRIQLTTPVATGDLDTTDYGEVKIVRATFDLVRSRILLRLQYGNTINGEWFAGRAPAGMPTSYVVEGADYAAHVTTHQSNDGELSGRAVLRGLYELLVSKSAIAAGVIS